MDRDGPTPLPPADQSLVDHPVPRSRDRTTYSLGPGAAPAVSSSFRTVDELLVQTNYSVSWISTDWHQALAGPDYDGGDDEIFSLVKVTEDHQARVPNPIDPSVEPLSAEQKDEVREKIRDRTWGFYVFVTDYSKEACDSLPSVLEKVITATRISIEGTRLLGTPDAFIEEAINRFRLEIVEDETTLEAASLDRVRAEFLALVRARRPDFFLCNTLPPRPIKNRACLVLDADAIVKLSRIELPRHYDPLNPDLPRELTTRMLKVVDAAYIRYENDGYSGWKGLSLTALPEFYSTIALEGNGGAVEDLWAAESIYPSSSI